MSLSISTSTHMNQEFQPLTNWDVDDITLNTAFEYAIKHYNNPSCLSRRELEEDYNRFMCVKRLLFRSIRIPNSVPKRLLVNHIIALNNVFGVYPTAKVLFTIHPRLAWDSLATLLDSLDVLPEIIVGIDGETVYTSLIPFNINLKNSLETFL